MKRFTPPRLRFVWALSLSLALHMAILFPIHWSFSDEPPASQIYLQANLLPPPPAISQPTERPEKSRKRPTRRDDKLTEARQTPPGRGSPAQPASPEVGKSEQEQDSPDQESNQAMILEQAVPPEYPVAALQRKLEGCVLAAVTVSASGEVSNVQILKSDHSGVFDQSVIDSQTAARYLPAQKEGRAVESRVLAVAAFVLDPDRKMNCALRFAGIAETMAGQRE